MDGLYRGSYTSAYVLLNLLNEFNKFNNTGAQMLDSIYHMTLKLVKNHIFGVKTSRFSHLWSRFSHQRYNGPHDVM